MRYSKVRKHLRKKRRGKAIVKRHKRKIKKKAKKIKGDCYKISGRDFMKLSKVPNAMIVHGEIEARGKRLGHSWIEVDDKVVFDKLPGGKEITMNKEDYYRKAKAGKIKKYSHEEFLPLIIKKSHWGPF